MRLIAIFLLSVSLVLSGCIDSIENHEIAQGKIDGPRPKTTPVSGDDGEFLDFDLNAYRWTAARAYRSGRYQQAAAYFLEILKRDVNNQHAIFDLAACYGQLGDAELAANYLDRAINAGYDGIEDLRTNDAFDAVRGDAAFDNVLERILSEYDQDQQNMGNLLYVESPRLLQCRVVTPENHNPDRTYPLVIGLHGYGDNHNDFIKIWGESLGEPPEFICAAPQAPYPFAVDDTVGYSWLVWDQDIPGLFEHSYGLGELYIQNVVEEITKEYNVGPVYLMGFSQGSAMALTYGIRNHEMFYGVVVVGGRLDEGWLTRETLQAGNRLKIFLAHGTSDRTVRRGDVEQTREFLESFGYDVSYLEHPGGHEVTEKTLARISAWVTLTSAAKTDQEEIAEETTAVEDSTG